MRSAPWVAAGLADCPPAERVDVGMMQMQRSTDGDEQPGAQDIGQGYPEENQAGTGVGAHTEQRSDTEPDNGSDDAPHTSPDGDGAPGQATGNPNAAGG